MADYQHGMRLIKPAMGDDMISSLPQEIIEKILNKLPIKDAVRISILSTKWRYIWASIPAIIIRDDELVPNGSRLIKIVDLLLFIHKGPILEFDLSTKHLCTEAFDRWILKLSRNGIAKLDLKLESSFHTINYSMPSNFFTCKMLKEIRLSNCTVKLPRNFKGFKLLETLKLDECSFTSGDIERLVSSSPQLVELSLQRFWLEGNLGIYAKELKILRITGVFSNLQIDAPQLDAAIILLNSHLNGEPLLARVGSTNNLCRTLGGLLNIKSLYLFGISIPYLVDEPLLRFPKAFNCLKKIALETDLANKKESNFVFSLLQSAINLQNIVFVVRMSEISNASTNSSFWEERSNLGFVMEHLQMVNILKFKASEPVLAFLKFILGSAPVLKKLILTERIEDPKEENPMVLKRLLKFRRASTKAEVLFD